MTARPSDSVTMPRQDDLGLMRIANGDRAVDQLPAQWRDLRHRARRKRGRIMINQVLASPIAGGLARLCLRLGGREPTILPLVGPEAPRQHRGRRGRLSGKAKHPASAIGSICGCIRRKNLAVARRSRQSRDKSLNCDAVLVQDLGLGERASS